MTVPSVVVFDVNETLSDLSPLERRFTDIGAPGALSAVWFASVLRDGFALATTGRSERFAPIAEVTLKNLLSRVQVPDDLDAAVGHVMAGFETLRVHPDVDEGVRALAHRGARLVTLTNGSTDVADRLLAEAGLREHFERLLSVDDAGVWKPAPGAYAFAARECAVEPADMLLVAVHPWDIHGAGGGGLRTAWVNRRDDTYPGYFRSPDHITTSIVDLAGLLA